MIERRGRLWSDEHVRGALASWPIVVRREHVVHGRAVALLLPYLLALATEIC